MAAALDGTRIAVFAHLDPDNINAAGRSPARRLDDVVGQILANKRRTTVGEIAYCKRRELRAPLDFGRPGCFRDERSVRRKELRVGGTSIGSAVKRVRGPCDELLDRDGIARRERTRRCSDGGRSGNLGSRCWGRRRRSLILRSRARRKEPARLDTPALRGLRV